MFCDGCDHYNIYLGAARKGWSAIYADQPDGRDSGKGLWLGEHSLGGTVYSFGFGMAYKPAAFSNQAFAMYTPITQRMVSWTHVGDGRTYISAYNDSHQSPFLDVIFMEEVWFFLELSASMSVSFTPPSSWVFDLAYTARVNEKVVGSGTIVGVDSNIDPAVSYVRVGYANGCDDIWITSGELLGDCRIKPRYPAANGAHLDFTPNGGAAHYDRIQEHAPDDDTTYLEGDTPGMKETESFDPTNATVVKGIGLWPCCKSTAGSSGVIPLLRSGGVDNEGTEQASGADYLYLGQCYRQSPFTGLDWGNTELNNLEAGMKAGT